MKKQTYINFLTGIGSVLLIAHFSGYIYPAKGDFTKDKKQMRQDALAFSKDLYSVTKKGYGKISLGNF